MGLEIFRFELRQQLRSPLFWLVALGLAALAFAAASSDSIQLGGGIGNVHRNAPLVVIEMLGFFSVAGLFLIVLFVAGAALRDFSAGSAELVFATPVPRHAYVGGRFAAGWLASVLVLAMVALGLWLGSLMPWLDPARLGPTPWAAYGWGFAVLVLPNLFFLATLIFLLATLTRSMLASYVGVIGFFVFWQVAMLTLGAGNIEHQDVGALLDPFGLGALDLVTRYWTPADKNLRVPALSGMLLANRGLWLAASAGLLALAFAGFRPTREGLRLWRRRKTMADTPAAAATVSAPVPAPPAVHLAAGAGARWRQFLHLAAFDTRAVLRGVPFLAMLAFGVMNLAASLGFFDQMFGTRVLPVTHLMAQGMANSYEFLLLLVLGFYAGELVWRERDGRISEVVDAFPTPDWIPLLSKVTALAAVTLVFLGVGALVGVGYQVAHGWFQFQPVLYLQFIALGFAGYLLYAILAVVLQVFANSKFGGYGLLLAYIVGLIALTQLHLGDHLYRYGGAPDAPYSDMNGFGTFWTGTLWFRAYWGFLALALLVAGALYWVRGTTHGLRARSRVARQRLGVPAMATLVVAMAGFVATGVYAFHNTHRLNRYETHEDGLERAARYEKTYRKYLGLAQPRITDVKVELDFFPERRHASVRGRYTLVNHHPHEIGELLVQTGLPDTRGTRIELDFPPHATVFRDDGQQIALYRLETPLAPGASMEFAFQIEAGHPGFANAPTGTQLVGNGSFLNNFSFPHFCYNEGAELQDENERRKHGLGPANRMAPRGDAAAHANNALSCDADWVQFEATLSTSADQIALAPGYLEREWSEGGRRYFHYVQDTPILDFFSFQSARYKVARDRWNDVALEVYHDPAHGWNVPRMIEASKHSLDYFTRAFGPYQFRQFRILEFPRYQSFAQSFANTVPYSEDIGFIADLRKQDSGDIDYVTYVTAHEIAHQWWGHQAIPANVQGATFIIESLAQYSALMVMKQLYGPTHMRKFLKYELDRYLSGRGGERLEEQPLATVENQPYIHYRKGSVVLYALQEYLGEDTVNRALRSWLDTVRFQSPPYTDSRSLIEAFRAAAGPEHQGLITDLLERITLFDNRMAAASARKLDDGRFEVTLTMHAAKMYADGKGVETPADVDIPIQVGIFARPESGREEDARPLHLERHRLHNGENTLRLVVDDEPWQAGIDPFNQLIDRVSGDNRMRVTVE